MAKVNEFPRAIPYIYVNGAFRKFQPIIIKTTNMGPLPLDVLMTKDNIPYLNKDKQFIRVPNSTNLTATVNDDYILYEFFNYNIRIY